MAELTALFLAGLSLFFTGVGGVKTKLQQMGGRKCRQMMARVTDRPVWAALVGMAAGAVTQSASAVAFILSGMVAGGMIPLRRALPVVAASNVGTTVLVFLAAFDMRLAVLYLIGLTGLMINFRIGSKYETLLGALFAIGLLFFGLDLMKRAFAPLPQYDWFLALAEFLKVWDAAPFLLGAALRMLIQSSSAIGVIAIALEHSNLFTESQAMLLVCGAGPGVALAGWFLSSNLTGTPKQIVIYQGLINLVSGVLLGAAIMADSLLKTGVISSALHAISQDSADRVAWIFLANMTGCLLAGLAMLPWAERWLQRLAPPTIEQDLSRPVYIHDEALIVPETAVTLVRLEQKRLFSLAAQLLDTVREEGKQAKAPDAAALHTASKSLQQEIELFLAELVNKDLTPETITAALALERRQDSLGSLEEAIHQFVKTRTATQFSSRAAALMDRLAESICLILMTATDAWSSGDEIDLEYLLKLTEDRGDMMERIRRSHDAAGSETQLAERSALFYATTLFERVVWLLRQIGLSLRAEQAAC